MQTKTDKFSILYISNPSYRSNKQIFYLCLKESSLKINAE